MDKDLTIPGAEFRRELGLGHKDCAKACLNDICCMAYEWTPEGVCLFKSRSLNGTVGSKQGVRFGLCFVKGKAEGYMGLKLAIGTPLSVGVSLERSN